MVKWLALAGVVAVGLLGMAPAAAEDEENQMIDAELAKAIFTYMNRLCRIRSAAVGFPAFQALDKTH